ncbi:hypothetical protein HG535_0F00860 [Zygotorulaspora mrakii]|uniref:Required for respiratory growth protein 7, mitochondrial n=1 Tax=Zygotorulaspora mrakii TaxID=42260 RepID=A0A7H9B5C9_ZYGMR|nr:uncharacterized protein HG535_0F00860 [Zygotorulaspora mrakii]QLG73576.1 hypothetical protein HG535_0F00860 [Zygotorulaspora mrakii]
MRLFKRLLCNNTIRKFINQNGAISQSSVFQGTLYEYTVMRELQTKLSMCELERVGGANDHGIDIKGSWHIKNIYRKMNPLLNLDQIEAPKRCRVNGAIFKPYRSKALMEDLKVLVQCKGRTHSKVGPREFRELIGTFTSTVTPTNRNKTVMLMCSPHMLTKNGLKLIEMLPIPVIYLRIELLRSAEGLYDLMNSGRLLNYYENQFAQQFLQGCGINEWLKLTMYSATQQQDVIDEKATKTILSN